MPRVLLAVLVVGMLIGSSSPALAHPRAPLGPADVPGLTYGSTDNVVHHGRFPEHAGTAGGRLSDDGELFYLTDPRGVFVYDVSTPRSPQLLDSIPLYQQDLGAALAQEDPDTDGSILLLDGATTPVGIPQLHVIDVSDPTRLQVLSTVDVTDHTWTCVSAGGPDRCAYAYGRTGHIVDLTDPSDPELLAATWREAVGYGDRSNTPYAHDLTEIRSGLVMSAGADAILMDTSDPTAPVRLAAIAGQERFSTLGYHSVEWADDGRAPYVVLGTEISPNGPTSVAGSDCKGDNSVVETWDAREILTALDAYEAGASAKEAFAGAAFRHADSFDAGGRGIFRYGHAPGHVLYCAHWMDLHPAFDAGGAMAVSYYNRGTRFVEVAGDGIMREIGWFVPADGYSGSPRWITDQVVYIMDYRRGLEVVELTDGRAPRARHTAGDVNGSAGSGQPEPAAKHRLPPLALGMAGFLLLGSVPGLRCTRQRRRQGVDT